MQNHTLEIVMYDTFELRGGLYHCSDVTSEYVFATIKYLQLIDRYLYKDECYSNSLTN